MAETSPWMPTTEEYLGWLSGAPTAASAWEEALQLFPQLSAGSGGSPYDAYVSEMLNYVNSFSSSDGSTIAVRPEYQWFTQTDMSMPGLDIMGNGGGYADPMTTAHYDPAWASVPLEDRFQRGYNFGIKEGEGFGTLWADPTQSYAVVDNDGNVLYSGVGNEGAQQAAMVATKIAAEGGDKSAYHIYTKPEGGEWNSYVSDTIERPETGWSILTDLALPLLANVLLPGSGFLATAGAAGLGSLASSALAGRDMDEALLRALTTGVVSGGLQSAGNWLGGSGGAVTPVNPMTASEAWSAHLGASPGFDWSTFVPFDPASTFGGLGAGLGGLSGGLTGSAPPALNTSSDAWSQLLGDTSAVSPSVDWGSVNPFDPGNLFAGADLSAFGLGGSSPNMVDPVTVTGSSGPTLAQIGTGLAGLGAVGGAAAGGGGAVQLPDGSWEVAPVEVSPLSPVTPVESFPWQTAGEVALGTGAVLPQIIPDITNLQPVDGLTLENEGVDWWDRLNDLLNLGDQTGQLLGGGGLGSMTPSQFDPVFSAQLPPPSGGFANLGPRTMPDQDWNTYAFRPEQSFFQNVPHGPAGPYAAGGLTS